MQTTMDRAGRLVIPKALRERIGLAHGGDVELRERDGVLELSAAPVRVRLEEREYGPVLVPDGPTDPLTTEQVRDLVERTRR